MCSQVGNSVGRDGDAACASATAALEGSALREGGVSAGLADAVDGPRVAADELLTSVLNGAWHWLVSVQPLTCTPQELQVSQ